MLKIFGPELARLVNSPKAILWDRDGLYGMIPVEVIRNALDNLELRNRISANITILYFDWNETVEVPSETGRAMESSEGERL